jgi:hypothetical protein
MNDRGFMIFDTTKGKPTKNFFITIGMPNENIEKTKVGPAGACTGGAFCFGPDPGCAECFYKTKNIRDFKQKIKLEPGA